MHLTADEEFANMELNEVQKKLRNLGEFSDNRKTPDKAKQNGRHPLFCILAQLFNGLKPQSPSDNQKCVI